MKHGCPLIFQIPGDLSVAPAAGFSTYRFG
jgi:hypothetical protein